MTKSSFVFKPLDLIAPWAICCGSAGLCIWAIASGEGELVGKIIAGVVGLVFLLGIPAWYLVRGRARKPDFVTMHGVNVVLGQKHKPSKGEIEAWTGEVINHWCKASWHRGGSRVSLAALQVKKAVDGVTVFFLDKEKIGVMGRWVRGYSMGKDIVIGMKAVTFDSKEMYKDDLFFDIGYSKRLYRHELSHPILLYNGEPWDEARHHAVFKQTNLGA